MAENGDNPDLPEGDDAEPLATLPAEWQAQLKRLQAPSSAHARPDSEPPEGLQELMLMDAPLPPELRLVGSEVGLPAAPTPIESLVAPPELEGNIPYARVETYDNGEYGIFFTSGESIFVNPRTRQVSLGENCSTIAKAFLVNSSPTARHHFVLQIEYNNGGRMLYHVNSQEVTPFSERTFEHPVTNFVNGPWFIRIAIGGTIAAALGLVALRSFTESKFERKPAPAVSSPASPPATQPNP